MPDEARRQGAERTLAASVIIPVFRDTERLRKCLRCLEQQTLPADRFEIIVVNNDPEEQLRLASATHRLVLLDEPTPGSYAARNRGLREARGEVLAFTDSDCLPEPDWLEQGLGALDAQGVDRVAGRVCVFALSDPPNAVECYETFFAFDQRSNVASGVAITANLLARASLFDKLGAFDDALLSGGDIEWNRRATEAGASLVFSDACRVLHPARSNWAEISKKVRRVVGGKVAIEPGYSISLIRSLLPPVEAGQRIFGTPGRPIRDKMLALAIAYRLKLYRYLIQRRVRSRSVCAER